MAKKQATKKIKTPLTGKTIVATLNAHRQKFHAFEVSRIGLFGSYLEGTQRRGSDIDILVSFKRDTFDNYMGLKLFLEKIFRRKVDLVMSSALKPAMEYVKKEAIYAKGS